MSARQAENGFKRKRIVSSRRPGRNIRAGNGNNFNARKSGRIAEGAHLSVMAGLRPGHPRLPFFTAAKTWMPGTRPGMTMHRDKKLYAQ
jgi:hypothetical protein